MNCVRILGSAFRIVCTGDNFYFLILFLYFSYLYCFDLHLGSDGFPYTATNGDCIALHIKQPVLTLLLLIYYHKSWLLIAFSHVLGGYIVRVTRFALKLKLRGAQRKGTIVCYVALGMYRRHICSLHHHPQNHQHLLKVQVIRASILEGSMTLWNK
jgi:hypothetical protein